MSDYFLRIGDDDPPSAAQMKRDSRWPYFKIVSASMEGKGTSLTADECSRMACDDAIAELAARCGTGRESR